MPNRAERGILARRPEREFIQVGLANEHGTCLAQGCDHGRVRAGNVTLTDARRRRRWDAGDVDDVLDRYRYAVQWTVIAASLQLLIRGPRVPSRFVHHDANER